MGQVNTTKSSTFQIPPSGKKGFGFDLLGNFGIIDESGTFSILSNTGSGITNILANLGLGLEVNLPAISEIGDTYVSTDTYKFFTVKDAISWDSGDLEKAQIIVDTSGSPAIVYIYSGSVLVQVTEIETTTSILTKIGDGSIISSSYLPAYVDEVIEVANYAALPVTGETSKIYITVDTSLAYRWSGTVYVQITSTPIYASQAEAEAGTENTKVITALRVLQSFVYQIANYTVSALNTAAKTIAGAINELFARFTGVYTDRGSWDASSNTYPETGGSGPAGAILQGDVFQITVAGTDLPAGSTIRALQDTPGQIASNWYSSSFGIALEYAQYGVSYGFINDQTQTIAGAKTFSDNLQAEKQAHGGSYAKAFSATAVFDANDGNNQEMDVTASTEISITNELPGTYIFTLEIDSGAAPVITINASFGTPVDNNATLINADNDINIITLVVRPNGTKYHTINTITA